MLIEVTDHLYKDMTDEERAACFIMPSTDTGGANILRTKRTTNISMNRWLRNALTAATGRSYVVQGGPTATAKGGKPPGAIDITYKGFRRAIQQYGLGKGLSDLDMRACCDWLSDSGVLYFEVDEDARGKLLRILNNVGEPLPYVVKAYAGSMPGNLSLSKFNFDSWEAMREFSLQCVQSAIPSYTRSPDVSQRMLQLIRAFEQLPSPNDCVRGKFSEQHWEVLDALPPQAPDSAIVPHRCMLAATRVMDTIAPCVDGVTAAMRFATVAAASAMAVALAQVPEEAQLAAASSIARAAAQRRGLPSGQIQLAAKAAIIAAPLNEPASWPIVFSGIVRAALGNAITDPDARELIALLESMRRTAATPCIAGTTMSRGSVAPVASSTSSRSSAPVRAGHSSLPPPAPARAPEIADVTIAARGGTTHGLSAASVGSSAEPARVPSRPLASNPFVTPLAPIPRPPELPTASAPESATRMPISLFAAAPSSREPGSVSASGCLFTWKVVHTARGVKLQITSGPTFDYKEKLSNLGGFYSKGVGWLLPLNAESKLQAFTGDLASSAPLALLSATTGIIAASAASGDAFVPSLSDATSSLVDGLQISDADATVSSTVSGLYTIPQFDPAPTIRRGGQSIWCKLHIPSMEDHTMFARFLLWHGRIPGWPALRIVCKPWKRRGDVTWLSDAANRATISRTNTVMKAINQAVGILPHADPTEQQIVAARAYISGLERSLHTSSCFALYNALKKKRNAKEGPGVDSDSDDDASCAGSVVSSGRVPMAAN